MSKLDDILTELENADERTTVARQNGKTYSNRSIHAQRKQQIKDLMLELIGDDEELIMPLPGSANWDAVQRSVGWNQMKSELRQKVREL